MSIKNIIDLNSQADILLPDNNQQLISPADVRNAIKDLNDSAVNRISDTSILGLKPYDSARTYQIGDGVFHEGIIYEAITITSGIFAPADWEARSGSSGTWGGIGGTLSSQTDLQAALDAKQDVLSANSPLSKSGNVLNIQVANAGQNGYLSSSDWNTFNSKENTISVDLPLVRTGNTLSIQYASETQDGVLSSADWISLVSGGIIDISYDDAVTAVGSGDLIKGKYYKILDGTRANEGLSTTGDVFLLALDTDKFSSSGYFLIKLPQYELIGSSIIGVWTPTVTPNIDEKYIFNGGVYNSITGDVGTNPDGDPTNWDFISKDNTTYYKAEVDSIEYDIIYDWIFSRADKRGNHYFFSRNVSAGVFNGIDTFQWGNDLRYGNTVDNAVLNNINDPFVGTPVHFHASNISFESTQGILWGEDYLKRTGSNDLTLLCDSGNINIKSDNADVNVIADTNILLNSESGDIELRAVGNVKLTSADILGDTVPYLDASRNFVSSSVSHTELDYLSGVTSPIQTQIDSLLTGLFWKAAVRVATTADGTLSDDFEDGDVIDGITLATGDRILIKNQVTASENGIYIVNASGAPTRAADFDTGADNISGATVMVQEGTVNESTRWTCATSEPITIGTTDLTFVSIGDSGEISDTSYSGTWNGITNIAPSKNAVFNAFLPLDGTNPMLDNIIAADTKGMAWAATGSFIKDVNNGFDEGSITVSCYNTLNLKSTDGGVLINAGDGSVTISSGDESVNITASDQNVNLTAGSNIRLHANTSNGDIHITSQSVLPSTVLALDASGNLISSSVSPTQLDYLSTVTSDIQEQLDDKLSSLSISDQSFSSLWNGVTDVAPSKNAVYDMAASIQTQIDAISTGLFWKDAVRVATIEEGTLATDFENGATIDDVVLATGDRILIKDQAVETENGIYIVNISGLPTRAEDFNAGADNLAGASVTVQEGILNQDTRWTCSTNEPVTIGSSDITFVSIGGSVEVSDTAYSSSWDGVTAIAPSKNAVYDALIPFNSQNYITVKARGNSTANGTNLLAAMTAAQSLTPNGASLSATNRAVVYLFAGVYSLGSSNISLGQYVDIIGLGDPKDIVITSTASAGTIKISNSNNYVLKNLTINNTGSGGSITHNASQTDNGIWDNLIIGKNNTQGTIFNGVYSKLLATVDLVLNGNITGTVFHSIFQNSSCGYSELSSITISGTIDSCIGGYDCFGSGGTGVVISGVIKNSIANSSAFGISSGPSSGAVIISGTIDNCESTGSSFGVANLGNVTISGSITNSKSGYYSFGFSNNTSIVTISGIIKNSIGDTGCFGKGNNGNVIVSGVIDSCIGIGNGNFANVDDAGSVLVSGIISNCRSGNNSFGNSSFGFSPTITISGKIIDCIGLDDCFGTNGVVNSISGTIINCQGGVRCFGDTTSVGKLVNCVRTGGYGVHLGIIDKCTFSENDAMNPVLTIGADARVKYSTLYQAGAANCIEAGSAVNAVITFCEMNIAPVNITNTIATPYNVVDSNVII